VQDQHGDEISVQASTVNSVGEAIAQPHPDRQTGTFAPQISGGQSIAERRLIGFPGQD
jgi:hypothetical protein